MAILAPNVHARALVLEFKEAKTREWEAAMLEWRWQQQEQQAAGRKDDRA